MYAEILQEARDRIAAQPYLWKSKNRQKNLPKLNLYQTRYPTCVGLAIQDAAWDAGRGSYIPLKWFLNALELPILDHDDLVGAIGDWNDLPETTNDDAVAGLDEAVIYARTQESQ
jgi:hypothetical protein